MNGERQLPFFTALIRSIRSIRFLFVLPLVNAVNCAALDPRATGTRTGTNKCETDRTDETDRTEKAASSVLEQDFRDALGRVAVPEIGNRVLCLSLLDHPIHRADDVARFARDQAVHA
jgi:hypothetical protein